MTDIGDFEFRPDAGATPQPGQVGGGQTTGPPNLQDYLSVDPTQPKYIGGIAPANEGLRQTSPFVDTPVAPAYLEGDEWKHFRGKSQEYILSVQNNLIQAGLLDPQSNAYTPGTWTQGSASAMKKVMIYSNQEAVQWSTGLSRIKSSEELAKQLGLRDEEDEPEFVPGTFQSRAFRPPSQETARAVVKEMIRQVAGDRFITDDLVNKYTRELRADYRRAFESDEAERERQFQIGEEERNAAFEERSPSGMGEATFDQIDPITLFQEKLNERFQFVREAEQSQEAAQAAGNNLNGLFSSITSAVRSGSPGGQQMAPG